MSKRIDETGKKYGMVTVLSISNKTNSKKALCFNCLCDCGREFITDGGALRRGNTKSCGCTRQPNSIKATSTHCDSKSKEYKIYYHIKKRCYNKQTPYYKNYGGRGIKMCDRWLDKYENFLQDMGRCPPDKYSIDRVDNNGDYEPSNCRWATLAEQSRNTRRNVFFEINGKKMMIKELCDLINIKVYQFAYLYYTLKLTPQEIYNRFTFNK